MPRAVACCIRGGQESAGGEPAAPQERAGSSPRSPRRRWSTSAWLVSPFAVDEAQAQRLLQISGAKRTATVLVAGRQDRGRAGRRAVHRHHRRRSGSRRRRAADRPRALDPRQEDRHHPRHRLRRRQAPGRHLRHRGVLRRVAACRPKSRTVAGPGIRVSSVNGRIMLSGTAPDAVTLDQAVTIARQFAPEIINTVQVASPQQVMLEVRFVEASRQAGRELGVQWNVFNSRMASPISARASRPASCRSRRRPARPISRSAKSPRACSPACRRSASCSAA